MEKKDKLSAREYVRSVLGSRPFVEYFAGAPLGYSTSSSTPYLPIVVDDFHHTPDCDPATFSCYREELREHAGEGRRAAMSKEFKSTPWYVAAVDIATRVPDFFTSPPSPDYLNKEAMVFWRVIADREAVAKYMATSVKSLGNVRADAVLSKTAPWMSEEGRMRALAEQLVAKGEI